MANAHATKTVPAWKDWLYTTDHKKIGLLYIWTSFVFFFAAGLAALAIRTELAAPGRTVMDAGTYYMMFSFHGTTMIFLWIIPVFAGFGNYLIPLLIGAPDMAYPRLNALSFWLFVPAAILLYMGFFLGMWGETPDVAAVGWTGYPPLSGLTGSPGSGIDFYLLGIHLVGVSSMMGAINFIVTILRMRAPGITFHNMSLFVWAQFTTAILITFATPFIGTAMMANFFDRNFGTTFFTADSGDPVLYQHLFWFYSHPAVYVMILPAMGIISEVLPRMVRRPIFGYKAIAYSTIAIAFLGFTVWAHHMFTTGIDYRARLGFMIMTMIIGVPTGVKFFNWIFTMWGGHLRWEAPLLFSVGFIAFFLIGGIDGVFMASIPVDYHLHDTYWAVSHLHYVLFGGSVMGVFAGMYYWWPRFTGRMYNKKLAAWHFWLSAIGLNVVFMTMHFLGTAGMPRRVFDYRDMYTTWNLIATIGAFLLGAAQIPFIMNLWVTARKRRDITQDPWNDFPAIEWRPLQPVPPATKAKGGASGGHAHAGTNHEKVR